MIDKEKHWCVIAIYEGGTVLYVPSNRKLSDDEIEMLFNNHHFNLDLKTEGVDFACSFSLIGGIYTFRTKHEAEDYAKKMMLKDIDNSLGRIRFYLQEGILEVNSND